MGNRLNQYKFFIYEEQGQIAPPIYDKYEQNYPEAILRMNSIVHQVTTDDPVETVLNLIVGYISGIPKFSVPSGSSARDPDGIGLSE